MYMKWLIVLLGCLGFWSVASAQSGCQTTVHWNFEDGQLRGTNTSMAVKPKILTESNGNKFMRITGSATDKQAIPASLTDRNRSMVRFTCQHTSMPLITDANRRQTYSFRMRFQSIQATTGVVALQLYQAGTKGESYGARNGTGPVVSMYRRTSGGDHGRFAYDNETKFSVFNLGNTPIGQWNDYKVIATWSHLAGQGRIEFLKNGVRVLLVTGRGSNLGDDTNRIPKLELGLYGDFAVGTIDVDNVQAYNTDSGPIPPPTSGGGDPDPDPPPPPPSTQTLFVASTTGSGTACTTGSPCSISQVFTSAQGGSTIQLNNGPYNYACNDCIKSGTSSKHTIVESTNVSGTPVAVGADKVLVNPGLATLTTPTAITLRLATGRKFITFRNLNITTSGGGTNPAVQVNDSGSTTATTDIVFENVSVSAPTRVGLIAGAYVRGTNSSARVKWINSRFHRVGPPVDVDAVDSGLNRGLQMIGPDHVVENCDFFDNHGSGFSGWPTPSTRTDRLRFARNRSFGNGSYGVILANSTDQTITGNEVFANARDGIHGGLDTLKRVKIYNNSVYANSLKAQGNFVGIHLVSGVTGVVRNNISLGHPSGQYNLPLPPASCSFNVSSNAGEPTATVCTNWTFNALAPNVWVDPDHPTLASRDFRLLTSPVVSVAIDNGTTQICTSANTSANLCTPTLTLTGHIGAGRDQGAHESSATPVLAGQLIADYDLDSDFLDLTALDNDGDGVGVTFDTTNKIQGAGAALFDAPTDYITIPLNGLSLSQGLTIALSGRVTALGDLTYLFGHSSISPSYGDRIQIKKEASDSLVIGLGSNRNALITSVKPVLNAFERYGLVIHPPNASGGGSFQVYHQGALVGSGTYTGLSQLGSDAVIGNNAGYNGEGWGGQIDKVRIWNHPRTASQMSADCDTFCTDVPDPGETFELGSCTIGDIGPDVLNCSIVSGAQSQVCDTIEDFQVTCGGVAKTETACTVSSALDPKLRLTLSTPCAAGEEVILTYANAPDPIEVSNVIDPSCSPMQLDACGTSASGLQINCILLTPPCQSTCPPLNDFVARDACVPQTLTACALNIPGGTIQLTRQQPPASPQTELDLIVLSTDQRLAVQNNFNQGAPDLEDPEPDPDPEGENPPVDALSQPHWRFRPVGLSDTTLFDGRVNTPGRVPSPGTLGLRLAITNQSGSAIGALRTGLMCSRQLPGGTFNAFVRVDGGTDTDPYNSIGLRYDPEHPFGLADGTQLSGAALPLGGLTENTNHRYRRRGQSDVAHNLDDNSQVEEEHALQLTSGIPLGTTYVCRVTDFAGNQFDAYGGLPGCIQPDRTFGTGEHPCGARFVVGAPRRW